MLLAYTTTRDGPRQTSSSDQPLRREVLIAVLTGLGEAGYVLKKRITALVEVVGERDYLACFPEADLSIGGDSVKDALSALKAEVVATYLLYRDEPHLGPEPRRRLKVLEAYVGKERGR